MISSCYFIISLSVINHGPSNTPHFPIPSLPFLFGEILGPSWVQWPQDGFSDTLSGSDDSPHSLWGCVCSALGTLNAYHGVWQSSVFPAGCGVHENGGSAFV